MASQVRSPGTAASVARFSYADWSNPSNVTSSNNTRATAVITSFGETDYLRVSNFGFSIPSDAVIEGIEVRVEHRVSSAGLSAYDSGQDIMKAGVPITGWGAAGEPGSSTTDVITTYGEPDDTWGETWTPAEINDSGFGFSIYYGDVNGGTGNVEVDHIEIEVHYIVPVAPGDAAGGGYLSDFPTIGVEIALDTPPLDDTPIWTDVSPYVRGFQTRRGRNHELDRVEAGTLRLRLNNRDRRFDPSYTSSPYYPNVVPTKRVRVRATWESVTYDLFHGFIEDWPQTWNGPLDAEINLQAVDAFTYFSKYEIASATWPQEDSGTRIERVLDAVGWPALDRDIDAGQSEVAAFTATSGFNALAHIQDVANTERGIFFIDGAGNATFHDRHRRITGSYVVSQTTFGDGDMEIPYMDMTVGYDAHEIRNDIRVQASGGTPQVQTDATSITNYMRRVYSVDTLLPTDSNADDLAVYLLGRYKDPFLRVMNMAVNPRMSSETATQTLSRELSDKVTVVRRPPPTGDGIVQPCHVEFITHDVSKANNTWRWRTQLNFSPAEVSTFWTLGDATMGVLGTSTHLAY